MPEIKKTNATSTVNLFDVISSDLPKPKRYWKPKYFYRFNLNFFFNFLEILYLLTKKKEKNLFRFWFYINILFNLFK